MIQKKIKFQDRGNFVDFDGIAVTYNGFAEFSKTKDFDSLIDIFCKKHKISKTNVLGEAIQVYYISTSDTLIISENRLIDKHRLARYKEESFKALIEHF